jgi:hypothetical protein
MSGGAPGRPPTAHPARRSRSGCISPTRVRCDLSEGHSSA